MTKRAGNEEIGSAAAADHDRDRAEGHDRDSVGEALLLIDQYPTSYLPDVGRQVMAHGGGIDYHVPLRLPIPGEDTEAMFRRLIEFSYAVGRQYRADGGATEEPGARASQFVQEELARPSEAEQAHLNEVMRPSPMLDKYSGYGTREAVEANMPRSFPTAHEFVQHQLKGNERQLPQMDRAAYQAMKEYSVLPLEMAAYEIPVAGQALAAVDLARSIGDVGRAAREGDKVGTAAGLGEAGVAATGVKGKLAKLAAAAMAGMAPEEAQAGIINKALKGIIAYHGSPHSFDKFDIRKIGTTSALGMPGTGMFVGPSDKAARMARAAEQGYDGPWYHGSSRIDRVVEKPGLDPKRATSGPMPYFTNSPALASKYAEGKADTSLINEGDVSKYFTVHPKHLGWSSRSEIPVEQSWLSLAPEHRQEILRRAKRVGYANPEEASGPLMLHPEGQEAILSPSQYDWVLKNEARGNPLRALRDIWHDSGELSHDPGQLEEIFRLAGYPHPISQKSAPWTEARGILPVMLRLQNPLRTASTDELTGKVIPHLEEAFKRDRTRLADSGADSWDKNYRYTPRDWVAQLREDVGKGANSYVWTSIPDKVTNQFKTLGYDSILDLGGKGGTELHDVAIPFHPHQVRSIFADFDPKHLGISSNILKSQGGEVEGYASGGRRRLTGDALKEVLALAERVIEPTRKVVQPDERMLAMHQVSPRALHKIQELGALPSPSIGLAKMQQDPLDFGEVTLIGRPHMAIPSEENPVFGQDVWSPRVPFFHPMSVGESERHGGVKYGLRTKEGLIPATPENIVEQMTRRPIIGGEYLHSKTEEADPDLGYVISSLTPKFGSFEDVSAARNRLIPREQANSRYVDLTAEHERLAKALSSSNWSPDYDEEPARRLGRAILSEEQRKGASFRDPLRTAYPGISDPQREWYSRHVENIRNLPTSYFEAKPQRVVDFGEFGGAVVPRQDMYELSPILKQMGINKVVGYDRSGRIQDDTHAAALREFPELSFADGGSVIGDALDVVYNLPQNAGAETSA